MAIPSEMILACDFGGSLTKIVEANEEKEISHLIVPTMAPLSMLEKRVTNDYSAIVVTGGKSISLPERINGVTVVKIPEFDSIAEVARIHKHTPGLIVSIGTGTPFIYVNNGGYTHMGGTGLGGGTIFGLASRLLQVTKISELEEMASKGDPNKVNLTVGDIVGSAIDSLPPEITASNFGKMGGDPNDIAAGLYLLVGEPIASMVALTLRSLGMDSVLFIGSSMKSALLPKILTETLENFGFTTMITDNPDYAILRGAISLYFKDYN